MVIQCEMKTIVKAPKSNDIGNTFELLESVEKQIEPLDQFKNITIVIGHTGSGKTTLIKWLNGQNQNSRLKDFGNGTKKFIIEDANRVGNFTKPQAVFYEPVMYIMSKALMYECPGFSDTRSSIYDIGAAYYVKKLTDRVPFVKLIVTVDYSSVNKDLDRTDFPNLLKKTLHFIKNVDNYSDSIAIVVTKVDYGNDETVKDEITSKFQKLQGIYKEQSSSADVSEEEKLFFTKAITLLNIFMTQTKRLQIFRRPDKAGPLKKMSFFENKKKIVLEMLQNELKFVEKGADDFGFALSDRSKSDAHILITSINDKVASLVSAIVNKVKNYYEKLIQDPESLNGTDTQESERTLVTMLKNDHEILVEFSTVAKSINNLTELANKTRNFIITQLGMDSCKDEVEKLAQQAKYFSLMEQASNRNLTTRPENWQNEFEKMHKYLEKCLEGMETFDRFLNDMLEKLSDYNIQKDKHKYNVANLDDWGRENKPTGIKIHQKNFKPFLKKLEETNLLEFDAKVQKINVTDFQLKKLNHVLNVTLKKLWNPVTPKTGELFIQGAYLKFSDFVDTNRKLIQPYSSGKILFLNIFALNVVFIDRDLTLNGVEVSIVAPKLEVIGKRVINLDGAPGGVQLQAKKQEKSKQNPNGVDGLPGLPGEPGGIFICITQTLISGGDLTISANGGQGGQGQQGADGKKLEPTVGLYDYLKKIVNNGLFFGKGGIGGLGGLGGEIKVSLLENNSSLPVMLIEPGGEGLPGGDGEHGLVPNGTYEFVVERQKPKQGKPVQSFSNIARSYKIFLLENLQNYFNKTILIHFVQAIENNPDIKNSYDTLALVTELQDLEKQYLSQKQQALLPFYESLLKRTLEFANNTKNPENSYKIVLSHLYTATLGKIQILKRKSSDTNLIIDLSEHLKTIQQHISDLKNLKEKSSKLKLIQDVRETYERNTQEKIQNVDYLIQKQVTPAINTLSREIEQEIDKLLDETTLLETNAKKKKTELIDRKKKLKRSLALSWVLSGVKMIGQAVGCLGPVGQIANVVLTGATTVAEAFTSEPTVKIPDEFSSQIESVKNNIKSFRQKPFSDFKDQLNYLHEETTKYQFNDTSKMIQNFIRSCDEAQANSDHKKLTELKTGLKTYLETEVPLLETKITSRNEKITSGVTMAVNRIKQFSFVGTMGLNIYSKIKNDNGKLKVLDEAIAGADQEIQGIEKYQTKIEEEMIPVVGNMGENLNNIARDLNNKSQIMLDITKWKVQAFLKDVKFNMQQLTKGFSVEHKLQHCIEKLDETITTIINVYDRTQVYQDQQQLAVYIAQISSPTESDFNVDNQAMNHALIELEKIIKSNLVFALHKAGVNALKQHVFPFAYHYLDKLKLFESSFPQEFDDFVSQAVEEVKGLQLKMTEYKTSITKSDSFMRTTSFSTDYKTSKPFYVWQNHEYQEEISKLLSGEKVMLKANILKSLPDKDAIKFNKISLKFNSENATLTKEISDQLLGFSVHATHMGNSYYRLNNNVYIIASNQQKIHFSFEKDADKKPVDRNSIYDKIVSADAMLSPYAMWEIQLIDTDDYIDFSALEKYKTLVNLELEGTGSYVTKEANISNAVVENYYTVAETILDDAHPRKRKVIKFSAFSFTSGSTRLTPWFTELLKALHGILIYNF